jgi:hypothetical protein
MFQDDAYLNIQTIRKFEDPISTLISSAIYESMGQMIDPSQQTLYHS